MAASKSSIFEIEIGNKKKKLYYKRPNQADLFQIDLKYRQIFSAAVKAGVMTESQTRKELAKNGSWTSEDDEKISKISLDIANLLAVMKALKDKKEERTGVIQVITRITELRATLMEMVTNRTSMLSQAAEGIANEQRMHKFVELCLYDADSDERFFDSNDMYQDYVAEFPDAMSEVFKQAYLFEYQTVETDIEDYPEMQALRDITVAAEAEIEETEKEEKQKSDKPAKKTRKRRVKKDTK